MNFTKMHGLGNDFVVINAIHKPFSFTQRTIRSLAARHTGIGFDQMLIIEAAEDNSHDFVYRIFNADGNEVEHCGNGARCFGKFLHDEHLHDFAQPVRVKVKRGIISIAYEGINAQNEALYSVDMGSPFEINSLTYQDLSFFYVNLGNPHAVFIVDNVENAAVDKIGQELQANRKLFPESVNVGFMQIVNRESIKLRVYERGVGETLACGTGACAAVIAGVEQNLLTDKISVQLRGGELTISYKEREIRMTGPAVRVFAGYL